MRAIRNLGRQYGQQFPNRVKKLREVYESGSRVKQQIFKFLEKDTKLFQQLMDALGVSRKNQVTLEAYYNFLWPAKSKEHKCLTCGATTKFGEDTRKYREFCSRKCLNDNPITVQRREQTMMDRYGVANANDNPDFVKKAKETLRKNYGVDSPFHSQELQQRAAETSLKKRGVRHHSQTEEYKRNFSLNNPMHDSKAKKKLERTNLKRYGNVNASKNKEVIAKIEKTHQERYGCNAGALAELQPNAKQVTDRFGVEHYVQGYENLALMKLSKSANVISIVSRAKDIGTIEYQTARGKRKVYYADLLAKTKGGEHRIEVKAPYTLFTTVEYFDDCIRKFRAATRYMKRKGGTFWLFMYVGQHQKPKLIRIKNPTCIQDIIDAGISVPDQFMIDGL